MEISPAELPWRSIYKLMIGSIVPRPIGWVSSINDQGEANLAPFSFFNAVCPKPPTILFCPTVRSTDASLKDTLRNIRATNEFVINIVNENLAAAMVLTSAELPAYIDEFEFAGLQKAPSVKVNPPRVLASPIHFECTLNQIIEISDQPGGGSIVIGTVVHMHVAPEVLLGEDKIDPGILKAIGRMGGPTYCRTEDIFDIPRPSSRLQKS